MGKPHEGGRQKLWVSSGKRIASGAAAQAPGGRFLVLLIENNCFSAGFGSRDFNRI